MSDEGSDPTPSGDEDNVDTRPDVIEIDSGGEETDKLKKDLGKPKLLYYFLFSQLISYFSCSEENLEVPCIFLFQT